jgi:predicted O-methyltransferase YrrM
MAANEKKLTTYSYIYKIPSENNKNYNPQTQYCLIGQNNKLQLSRSSYRLLNPYSVISGWCCEDKIKDIFFYINKYNCKNAFEIGIFGGSSFIPIAQAIKANNGVISGCDPWNSEASNEYEKNNENLKWWGNLNYVNIKNEFYKHLENFNVKEISKIYEMKSEELGPTLNKKFNNKFDFLHIDGNHNNETALIDIFYFINYCKDKSIIFFDDIYWDKMEVIRNLLNKLLVPLKIYNINNVSYGIYMYVENRHIMDNNDIIYVNSINNEELLLKDITETEILEVKENNKKLIENNCNKIIAKPLKYKKKYRK